MTLEEIAKNFGEEVAVHVTDATDEEKARLERQLAERSESRESVDAKAEEVSGEGAPKGVGIDDDTPGKEKQGDS